MSCDLTDKVSLLIDGELPPGESHVVERHLLECAECQQMRVDFLIMRSRISAYMPQFTSVAPRFGLARLLSQPGVASKGQARSERLLGALGARRLTPALATVAILIVGCALAAVLHFKSVRDPGFQATNVQKQPIVSSTPAPPLNHEGSQEQTKSEAPVERNSEPKRPRSQRSVASAGRPASRRAEVLRDNSIATQPQNMITPDYLAPSASGSATTGIAHVRSADTETLTAQHLEQSELLLRTFRNVRLGRQDDKDDLGYERRLAQRLFYRNVMLRREADTAGDVQVATLLESLEPILLDIAHLPGHTQAEDLRAINERVERQNLVALLQVNSTSLARAYQ